LSKTEFLYGVSSFEVHKEVVKYYEKKIKLSEKLLIKICETPLMDRDFNRLNEVQKAIEFNKERLRELKEEYESKNNTSH
jgi:hypothetical protein